MHFARLPLNARILPVFPLRSTCLLAAFLGLVLGATPARAVVHIEGEIVGAPEEGRYDLALEVSGRDGIAGQFLNLQSVRVVRVVVSEGRFRITLDTGLDAYAPDNLAIEVRYRPFDTYGQFKQAVVSRVTSSEKDSDLAFGIAADPSGAAPFRTR